jgi:hypothetical protein
MRVLQQETLHELFCTGLSSAKKKQCRAVYTASWTETETETSTTVVLLPQATTNIIHNEGRIFDLGQQLGDDQESRLQKRSSKILNMSIATVNYPGLKCLY